MYIAGVGTSKRRCIRPCIRKAFWRNLKFSHYPFLSLSLVWMDGWMDGWMDERIGGCFDTLLEESVVIILYNLEGLTVHSTFLYSKD